MGAAASTQFDPRHVRIWNNLTNLESPVARIQMLDTLFSAQEYVNAAKRAGLYASLLQWKAAYLRGEYSAWPGQQGYSMEAQHANLGPPPPSITRAPASHVPSQRPPTLRITDSASRQQLAVVPPPKRALDVLHESYRLLGLDDSKPLTHDALRAAYKRAALRVHPDKGGSPEAFDAVTRAFTYVQEVLDKLIPKTAKDGSDPRFSAAVTPETALKARGIHPTAPAPAGTPQLADAPPIALNPKKLDMNVFNKLFEENKLPDPDADDGYGDWLKSQDNRGATNTLMRGKYNADMFNKMFSDEALRNSGAAKSEALAKYAPPADLVLAPGFGVELGRDRPAQFTKTAVTGGGGLGYTDLKFAYGEGSTFSQEVANVSMDGRPRNLEEAKREYGSAPTAMSAEQAAAVAAFERTKELAEQQRRQRLAAHDVDAESLHTRMQQRLMIRN
jgi:curved DNA-binding protein CbpA